MINCCHHCHTWPCCCCRDHCPSCRRYLGYHVTYSYCPYCGAYLRAWYPSPRPWYPRCPPPYPRWDAHSAIEYGKEALGAVG